MAKDTQPQRHNSIVQNEVTRQQGVEAVKRIAAEVEMRRREMGPLPDPTPRDSCKHFRGIGYTESLADWRDSWR